MTGAGTNFSSVDAKFQLRNKKQIHGFNIVLYQSKIILQPIFILIKLSTIEIILSFIFYFFKFCMCVWKLWFFFFFEKEVVVILIGKNPSIDMLF